MSVPVPPPPPDTVAESHDDTQTVVRPPIPVRERRIRFFFRMLTMTGLFVSVGLLLLCRDRYAEIFGLSRPQSETVQSQSVMEGETPTDIRPPSDPSAQSPPPGAELAAKAPPRDAFEQAETRDLPDIVPEPPRAIELRFLGVVVRGIDFVFVLDGSEAMGGPARARTPFAHAKNEVMRSISELQGGNRFQLVVSGDPPRVAPLSDGIGRLAVPTRNNRRAAAEFLSRTSPTGTTNARDALLTACRLEPTSILFICDTIAPSLTRDDLSLLSRAVRPRQDSRHTGIAVHVVEIGDTIEPPTDSTFARLAVSSGGQYYYMHAAAHRIEIPEQRIAAVPVRPDSTSAEETAKETKKPTPTVEDNEMDITEQPGKPEEIAAKEPTTAKEPSGKEGEPDKITEKPKPVKKSDEKSSEPGVAKKTPPKRPEPKKYDLPRSDQTKIEQLAKSLYFNAAASECLLNPQLLDKPSEKVYETIPTVLKGAKAGFPPAEMLVGLFYMNATQTPTDETKGFDCFLRGAQEGYPPAMTLVSDCFRLGRGIPIDEAQAKEWCLKAAEQNDPVAMLKMSLYFVKLPKEKFEWMRKAAQNGYPEAMFQLANMYQMGIGTPKELSESRYWIQRAAELGHAKARAKMK